MQLADDEDFGSHCLGLNHQTLKSIHLCRKLLSYDIMLPSTNQHSKYNVPIDNDWHQHQFQGKWRTWMWNVMEYPWTSQTARSF